jgi:pilus assembly protein CpaC
MKRSLLTVLYCLAGALAPALHAPTAEAAPAAAAETENQGGGELDVAVGENKTIPADGVRNYSEGAKGIAEVKLTTDRSKFVIVGQKPGATTLLLIKEDGTQETWFVNVYSRSMDSVRREIEQLLEGSSGVHVRRVGRRVFIEGGVASEDEKKRVQQIAGLYPGQAESLVVVGASPQDRKIDIRIDFFFVQYSRSRGYAFGIDWPGRIGTGATAGISYDFLASATKSAQASISSQPLPALDIAAHNGWAKVLKQSTVISSNGTEATFESGGQQNFPVTTGLAASVHSIDFGTNLTVLPRYDPKTREMTLKLTANVSDLQASASSTLPSKSTSKLVTNVDLKLGQSLILSGIRTRSERHGIRGLPLLSEIPIIGVLFGSHANEAEDTDGAIFIIPSVIETVPQASMDVLTRALARYETFTGQVDSINAYDHRPPVVVKSSGKDR